MSDPRESSPFPRSTAPKATAPFRNTLVEVRVAGEMGLGLFAVRDIRRGARIIEETPLIALPATWNDYTELGALISGFKQLTEEEKNVFHALHYSRSNITTELKNVVRLWRKDTVLADTDGGMREGTRRIEPSNLLSKRFAIFRANCVPIQVGGAFGHGLFALFSRINHSCIPNAHWVYNATIERLTVHAISHIRVGQQITICYVKDPTLTKLVRNSMLAPWRFSCNCAACTDPVMEARNLRIQELKQLLATHDMTNGPLARSDLPAPVVAEALPAAMELVALLEKQGLVGTELASAYHSCAKHSLRIGSFRAARNYAALEDLTMRYAFGWDRVQGDGNTEDGFAHVEEVFNKWSQRSEAEP